MKKGLMVLAAGLLAAGALTAGAEEKIGVVNGQEAVKSYHKTQAATDALRKLDDELRDAQRRLVGKLEEMDDAAKKAIAEASDKALSEEARARKRNAAEEKLTELKEFEVQVRKSDLDNRRKMDEQNSLMLKPIIQDVRQAVAETAREKGLTLVLDGSESGLGPVLFAAERLDITDDVLKRLNKNVPAPVKTDMDAPAGAKSAAK
ncbi:MAG: OmpH family outer membrane protein [Kiritimatiellia bacterium]